MNQEQEAGIRAFENGGKEVPGKGAVTSENYFALTVPILG
jgi:hypothetical protein